MCCYTWTFDLVIWVKRIRDIVMLMKGAKKHIEVMNRVRFIVSQIRNRISNSHSI